MSDDQSGKKANRQSTPRKIALLGAVATVLAIINMSTGSEVPAQAVAILQYVALGLGLLALVGGLIMMMAQK